MKNIASCKVPSDPKSPEYGPIGRQEVIEMCNPERRYPFIDQEARRGLCVFGSDEICVIIKKNPGAHLFVCVVQPEVVLIPQQARGSDLSLHVALKSVWGGNTADCSLLRQPFVLPTRLWETRATMQNDPPLGGENFLRWAINQQLVISTSYSRLPSYKWGNSCRQEPQGKQDVKISDRRLDSFSRLQLVRVFESSEITESLSHWVSRSAQGSVIVYSHGWCMAGFKY